MKAATVSGPWKTISRSSSSAQISPSSKRIVAVGVAVEPRRVDVEAARQQRLVGAAEVGVAVDAHAAEVHAVVALAQADELDAIALAAQLPVLARDLERAFDRVRAAVAEHHGADIFGLHHLHQARRRARWRADAWCRERCCRTAARRAGRRSRRARAGCCGRGCCSTGRRRRRSSCGRPRPRSSSPRRAR